MLTLDKLKAYGVFGGDIDGHARSTGKDKPVITDADWYLIDELLMALDTVASGMASAGFIERLERRMAENTADQATRDALTELAARRRKSP
ncbi:MAG: hypothetical protein KBF58_07760 [Methyloversatilis sp.]|jgi:hypothetical protein|nr:hypothetical protein [Methyloversatilis sp.]MBP6193663.1 hypothetical protein [Methyloversatilis sp.]MBP9117959.1 hypothetical protein [Methyloversatilis sp.]